MFDIEIISIINPPVRKQGKGEHFCALDTRFHIHKIITMITGQNHKSELSKTIFPNSESLNYISPEVETSKTEKSKFIFSKDKTTNSKTR